MRIFFKCIEAGDARQDHKTDDLAETKKEHEPDFIALRVINATIASIVISV